MLPRTLASQAARIASYMLAGALFGIFGASLYGVADFKARTASCNGRPD